MTVHRCSRQTDEHGSEASAGKRSAFTRCYFYPPASWRYGGSRQNKIKVLSLFDPAAVSLGDGGEPRESFSCPRDTDIDF